MQNLRLALAGLALVILASLALHLASTNALADSGESNSGGWTSTWCLPPFLGCGSYNIGSDDSPDLPGTWAKKTFENSAVSRVYYLYTPKNGSGAALPLVVGLHGCTQDAPTFAAFSGLSELGEKYGFAVVYPEESEKANSYKCWNWFDPGNTVRGSDELSIIMGIVQEVSNTIQVDSSRVYAAGFSAGGSMAINLVACYSDVFSGGLAASALQFRAATDADDATEAMQRGSKLDPVESGTEAAACTPSGGRVQNMVVIHGDQDSIVKPVNSLLATRSLIQMNDILDDGAANGSQSTTALSSHSHTVAGGGDQYKMDSYGGTDGTIHVVNVVVHTMGHAWSGAHVDGIFSEMEGPDAGDMMWQFLSASH